jgi:hypothetical protein
VAGRGDHLAAAAQAIGARIVGMGPTPSGPGRTWSSRTARPRAAWVEPAYRDALRADPDLGPLL